MVPPLLKRTVNLRIDKAYSDVKAAFAAKGCKIISEDPPKQILVKQGSLWGASPRTAKKTITIDFERVDSETQVTCSSQLTSDWKNLTVVGCALAALLVSLCLWITFDLEAFMVNQNPNFWSWLITVNGGVNFQIGHAFVTLTKSLAIFLSAAILLEVGIVAYVKAKLDRFADETLNSLLRHET